MKVKLSTCGNIDHNQDPTKPLFGIPVETKECGSFEAASNICQEYIFQYEIGGGNWTGGQIYSDKGEQIARVSYNGRVWDMQGKEIAINN